MMSMSIASGERISEVLSEEPDITNPENPVMDIADGSIKFSDVEFTYNKDGNGDPVLKDIDLEIKSGETIGIIGGTGSSKSTLVMMIPRLYDVNGGSVKVSGVDVRDFDLKYLRSGIGVVTQESYLFNGTILDNLKYAKDDATMEEIEAACKVANIHDFIVNQPDGYNTEVGNRGLKLSGGEKQICCI